jgi:hypothetical protein
MRRKGVTVVASVELIDKPHQAGWRGKAVIAPAGSVRMHPIPAGEEHDFGPVELAWYDNTIKLTLLGAGPAKIVQSYLKGDGRDVIIEIEV